LDIKIKQPHTLADTIGVARLIEEGNQLHNIAPLPIRSIPTSVPSLMIVKASSNPTAEVLGLPQSQRIHIDSNTPPASFRKITNQETQERREKGLCYFCDEKFIPGHHCQWP